jgi:hypothetical protein
MVQHYQIDTPTLVLAVEGIARMPIIIPSDSVIEVPRTLYGRQGLIEVQFNGTTVLMFAEDIRQRGRRVSKVSAARQCLNEQEA